jgi:hypothetical protein
MCARQSFGQLVWFLEQSRRTVRPSSKPVDASVIHAIPVSIPISHFRVLVVIVRQLR